ncbi:PDZ domain-containing protein [Halobacillus sp. Nhm2S1]|uniref:PDZ domain-containing protein n=1 Tax=Halobacillus sp. Nhm2S1 TaxID=2866716 RepID=UPI001C73A8FF|nr:PDZ domain-containing protein [Halobacillus sp. Nhm2S1]MBX0357515.1 PDZ domain-containing protein [Halobacillus sp. Nhm2S1]
MDVWLMEFAKGIGMMFTLPFLYIALAMIFYVSGKRIKQERATFGTRIFDRFSEWKGTWGTALLSGFILSAMAVGGGMVVSYPLLILLSGVFLIVSLTGRLSWYSSAYTLGLSYLVLLVIPYLPQSVQGYQWVATLQETPLHTLAVVMAVLLMTESILMLRTTASHTYPERLKGTRGMWIGQHRSRRMTFVPFLALLPGGMIEAFAPWWPLISLGGDTYGLILIPFVIGWEWKARGQSPVRAAKTMGRHVFLLAILVLGLAVASFFISVLSLAAVMVGLVGREFIFVLHRMREEKTPFFSSAQKGIRILGVIPGSPADQMELMPGEVIERVNAIPVRTENQFYEALQNSGAFTKMEVRDEAGENRYVQRAMYEGEHYELGLVFVEPATHEASVGFF